MSRRGGFNLRPALRALAAALLGVLMAAPAAQGFVYWANAGKDTTIGRANLDGSGANESFVTGGASPCGVAVDGQHIYWANDNGNSIGRANLDGSGVNQFFITGANSPCGVAVDGAHVYWANGVASGSIGRANLDGSSPNQHFITGATNPTGVAVDGAYVYWANYLPGTIGRANLDGTSPVQNFITGGTGVEGVAVDSAHIYWANFAANGTIGRANLNGTAVDQSFITGADGPCGVAVDSAHIYWANGGYNDLGTTIGRANVDGSGVDQSFIAGATTPCGVTADALTTPIVQPPPVVLPPGHGSPPTLTRVSQSHRRWREGNTLPHIASVRPPVGTTFRFTLNEAARVRFVFKQRLPGRRVGGRCVAPAASNLSKLTCTRTVSRGTLSFTVGTGAHKLRFQGRLSKHKRLPSGRYTLIIAATNAAGQRAIAKLTFAIVA